MGETIEPANAVPQLIHERLREEPTDSRKHIHSVTAMPSVCVRYIQSFRAAHV